MGTSLIQVFTPKFMNFLFGFIMIFLFFKSISKIKKNPNEYSTIPNAIAVLGIIGTFLGILLGLLEFKTGEIQESIPKLLEGMKTAFITSLIGLSLSTILKSFQSARIKKTAKESGRDTNEVSLERIADLMIDIKNSMINSNNALVEAMKDMRQTNIEVSQENRQSMQILVESLTSDKEFSLVSQMRELKESMIVAQKDAQDRLNTGLENMGSQLDNLVETNTAISTEIERGNNVLIEEFRVFAKNMAENNMKAFTEAIQECIRDLNNQLQEQFGENFKHLNLAVEKLLDWQIHYKETVEKATENQIEIYEGMSLAKELIIEINKRSMSIVEVANRLGDKILTFDTQQQSLNNSIEVLNKISTDAIELIPNLDKYLFETKNMANKTILNVEKMAESLENKLISSSENIENHIINADTQLQEHTLSATKKIAEYVHSTTKNAEEQQNEIVESLKNLTTSLEKSTELNMTAINNQISGLEKALVRFENEGFTLTKKISDNIQNMVENNNSNLTASIENINELLTSTLNTSLQSLGEQLAAVSEKFVSDYTPLTIELQKLVNLAKKVG